MKTQPDAQSHDTITLTFIPRDSIKPVTLKVSRSADFELGRSRPGEVHGMLSQGSPLRMSFDISSLSEKHARLVIRDGSVYVTDLQSRNKTMLCIPPETERAVDGAAVWFGPDLALHVNDAGWDLPPTPERMSRDDLLGWLEDRLRVRGMAVELGAPAADGIALGGSTLRLVLRHRSHEATVDAQASAWTQAAVSVWNAAQLRGPRVRWRFVAHSQGRLRVQRLAERLAPTKLPVLLVGPAASGRHVLAQDLHDHGSAPEGPFVTFRVDAVPRSELDAALFGGTVQGTVVRGAAEQAVGGTLYIDEVSLLAPNSQVKLLRLLDSAAGPRVIAATVHDLRGRAEGFREDLYWRISALRIDVPAPTLDDLTAIAADLLRYQSDPRTLPSDEVLHAVAHRAATHPWRHGAREMCETLERLLHHHPLDGSWVERWDALVPSQRRARATPTLPRQLPLAPSTLGRMLADVLFLRAAEETPQRALLARRLQMTYQGADARAVALSVELDVPSQILERRKERESALRLALNESPELRDVIRSLIEG